MNNPFKKTLAVILSIIMVLATAMPTFAAVKAYARPDMSVSSGINGIWSQNADGTWQFVSDGGAAKNGWFYLNISNSSGSYSWFCFDESGLMRTGWINDRNDSSIWYYSDETKGGTEGCLKTGWITDPQDGKKYYLEPETGIMVYGWKLINGSWYYFGEKAYADKSWSAGTNGYWTAGAGGSHSFGSMYSNEYTPDGYYVGAGGVWNPAGKPATSNNHHKDDPVVTKYDVIVSGDNGKVYATVYDKKVKTAEAGIEITFTAEPDEGYSFDYWEVISGGVDIEDKTNATISIIMPSADLKLKALFKKLPTPTFTITLSVEGEGKGTARVTVGENPENTIKCNKTGDAKQISANPGDIVTLWATPSDALFKEWKINGESSDYSPSDNFPMPDNNLEIQAVFNSSCIAAGTMITMEDGTRKPVEEIIMGDMIRTFNHETGTISSAPVIYVQEDKNISGAFTLHFDKGIDITVIEEHGFFDKEINQYAFINPNNVKDYVGHHFYNADDNSWIELKGYEVLDHPVDSYDIISSVQLNHLSEGILSMSDGAVTSIANLFEYDEGLMFNQAKKNQDIQTYGLASREDLADYKGFLDSSYIDYNLMYLPIMVGKGFLSWEEMKMLSDYYDQYLNPLFLGE